MEPVAGGLAAWRLPSHSAASQYIIIVEVIISSSISNDSSIITVILFFICRLFFCHLLFVLCSSFVKTHEKLVFLHLELFVRVFVRQVGKALGSAAFFSLRSNSSPLCVFFPLPAGGIFCGYAAARPSKLFGFNSLSSPDSKMKREIKGTFQVFFSLQSRVIRWSATESHVRLCV